MLSPLKAATSQKYAALRRRTLPCSLLLETPLSSKDSFRRYVTGKPRAFSISARIASAFVLLRKNV
jgi:hypothetical protein